MSSRMRFRMAVVGAALVAAIVTGAVSAAATGLFDSSGTDLVTTVVHQLAGGVNIPAAPVQYNSEPPLTAVPPAQCGSGSRPDPAPVDGQVPASVIPAAQQHGGFTCNLTLVAHQGHSGGFKVWRYFDSAGHECAYYDTALLYPLNALRLDGTSQGVAVVDMTDPAHPVQTDTLTSLPMLSPHESLNLDPQRGLLAADLGNPATYPGLVSIYSVNRDCRHPVLDATGQYARWGHESGFSPNGTFWATGTAFPALAAIDTTDPHHPKTVWDGNVYVHGLNISSDGNRAYLADATEHKLIILDTSQIQRHVADPQVREISALSWLPVSIPQNAIPFTEHAHPYLLEFDEYATGSYKGATGVPGGARIIDLADERHPRVISDIRLQVHQPAQHAAASGDPGAFSPVQGYAAHYCNIPTRVNPAIVACSMIDSGLRVFDIEDVVHPREIAYFVAPPSARIENGLEASDFAMSRPEFAPERREIWFTDGPTGFYVLRLDPNVWPAAADPTLQLSPMVRRTRSATRITELARTDHDGEGAMPVPGVTIAVGSHRAVTDATGTATIVVPRNRSRARHRRHRLVLTASMAGYRPARASIAG